jgi:hypothetical protein
MTNIHIQFQCCPSTLLSNTVSLNNWNSSAAIALRFRLTLLQDDGVIGGRGNEGVLKQSLL